MAGAGGIGTDAYTRMINDKLIQLDTRFAIDNQYTPLVGDYSGLRGGSRKKSHITPGISATQYPLNYPESYAISAGARHMINYHPLSGIIPVAHMVSPVNSVYPSVLPMGMSMHTRRPRKIGGKRATKGSMSMTHPGEIDYTTKKGSMVHHIQGHYVRSLPRPYAGGKLPSLKDIGRSISRGAKKLGSQIVSGAKKVGSEIKTDYQKSSPQFKSVVRRVLPTLGSIAGNVLGDAGAIALGNPELAPLAGQFGSMAGNSLGQYANRKIGLGRRKKKVPVHSLPNIQPLQMIQAPVKGGARKSKSGKGSRQAIVKQVMQQHGLSLPMASKYVKENGLY
jgi:hypothetical protein